jgi:hypothetical protein
MVSGRHHGNQVCDGPPGCQVAKSRIGIAHQLAHPSDQMVFHAHAAGAGIGDAGIAVGGCCHIVSKCSGEQPAAGNVPKMFGGGRVDARIVHFRLNVLDEFFYGFGRIFKVQQGMIAVIFFICFTRISNIQKVIGILFDLFIPVVAQIGSRLQCSGQFLQSFNFF